jgi:hypothetical protein
VLKSSPNALGGMTFDGFGGGGSAGALSRTGGGPISAWLPARAWREPGDAMTPVRGIGNGATCEPSLLPTRIVGSLRSKLSTAIRGDDCDGTGGGLDGELERVGNGGGFVVEPERIGGGFVVEPERIGGGLVVDPERIGGGFVVEPARGGSAPDAIDAFAGLTLASGGGLVVEPARIGGGLVVEPARGNAPDVFDASGGGFVVDPERGAKPCVFVGLGAAAKPAAVFVVDVSEGIAPERSCAAPRSSGGIAPERSALGDDGRAAGVRTFVDVASGPPTTVGSALRTPPPTWTLVDVASPMGPLWYACASGTVTSGAADGTAIGGGFDGGAERRGGGAARGGSCTPVGGALRSLRRGGNGGNRRLHAVQTDCSSAFSALQKGQKRIYGVVPR